jgi:hypothetical protein
VLLYSIYIYIDGVTFVQHWRPSTHVDKGVNTLVARLLFSLINIPSIQVAEALMHWCGKGDLMELIVNELRFTRAGMMQFVGVTSVFMALLSLTSKVYMKVWSHRNFIISHFHSALCSLSEPPLHRKVLTPRASLSLLASILCPFLTCNMHIVCFSLELVHCLLLHLSLRRGYPMLRERGKPKRGPT